MENEKTTKKFVEDPRYKQCNREALMGLGLGILNLIWWFVWGYGLGSMPPEQYTYVLGLPLWFFMSCVVGGVLFTVLAIIMVKKYIKDVPLDRISEEEAKEIRGEG